MAQSKNKRKNGKRKPHVDHERAKQFFIGTTIWTWEGLRDVNGEPYQNAKLWTPRGVEDLSDEVIDACMRQPNNKWLFFVRALCHSPATNHTWVQPSRARNIEGRLRGNAKRYWELRDDALETLKTDQIVDVGWLAYLYKGPCPVNDIEQFEAMKQFELGGITDYRQQLWREVNDDVAEQREAA